MLPVNRNELENWRKIQIAMAKSGKTDNWYFKRATAILSGFPDPLPLPPPCGAIELE
jgi:hypothetical protein